MLIWRHYIIAQSVSGFLPCLDPLSTRQDVEGGVVHAKDGYKIPGTWQLCYAQLLVELKLQFKSSWLFFENAKCYFSLFLWMTLALNEITYFSQT